MANSIGTESAVESSRWTREEDKQFESYVVEFAEDSADRWERIAARMGTKSAAEVERHYALLVEDVAAIEAGLIELPPYSETPRPSECPNPETLPKLQAMPRSTLNARKRRSRTRNDEAFLTVQFLRTATHGRFRTRICRYNIVIHLLLFWFTVDNIQFNVASSSSFNESSLPVVAAAKFTEFNDFQTVVLIIQKERIIAKCWAGVA